MNPDLRDLYQEVILDHNRNPRNLGRLDSPSSMAEGKNPLCGDEIHLELLVEGGKIADVKFEGHGCAISMASASLLTEAIKGKSLQEAHELFNTMHDGLTGTSNAFPEEELMALSGVRDYPVRIKCAVLPWHALKEALERLGS